MRYYLLTIQYNKEAQAENRTVPKAFDSLDDAMAEFHTQMGKDMKNKTLGWALSMVINSDGGIHASEKWTSKEVTPAPVQEEEVAAE